eukprot:403359703
MEPNNQSQQQSSQYASQPNIYKKPSDRQLIQSSSQSVILPELNNKSNNSMLITHDLRNNKRSRGYDEPNNYENDNFEVTKQNSQRQKFIKQALSNISSNQGIYNQKQLNSNNKHSQSHKQLRYASVNSSQGNNKFSSSSLIDIEDIEDGGVKNLHSKSHLNLIKAKQEKHQSIKNAYSMQSRILKLKVEEDRLLKKIDNERRKAEELQKIRQSYDLKMRDIKLAVYEREQKISEIFEINQNKKNLNQMYRTEKVESIFKQKKDQHDEVVREKHIIEKEKIKFAESVAYQKQVNALMIKDQLEQSKKKLTDMKMQQDEKRKQSYIERVKLEKKKKRQTDKQIKQLAKIEQEMFERYQKTQELYKNLKPGLLLSPQSHSQSLNNVSISMLSEIKTSPKDALMINKDLENSKGYYKKESNNAIGRYDQNQGQL